MKLTDFESALDEQRGKIQKIEVKKCPIQRCNASFFDEWSHRWDFHPDSSSRYWRSGPEVFEFFETDDQITAPAEDFNPKWQVDQIRGIEEETEEDTFEAATKKQEDSAGSPVTDFQILHASNREEDFRPDYAIVQENKSKDATEADEPDPEPKEKKGIIDPLPIKKQRMSSVADVCNQAAI